MDTEKHNNERPAQLTGHITQSEVMLTVRRTRHTTQRGGTGPALVAQTHRLKVTDSSQQLTAPRCLAVRGGGEGGRRHNLDPYSRCKVAGHLTTSSFPISLLVSASSDSTPIAPRRNLCGKGRLQGCREYFESSRAHQSRNRGCGTRERKFWRRQQTRRLSDNFCLAS